MSSKVQIDHREIPSGLPEILVKRGVEVEIINDQMTDYVIGGQYGIERKTVTDFLVSIKDKRIFRQAHDLSASFECPFVIIEGNGLYKQNSQMNLNVIRGVMLWLSNTLRVPVIRTENIQDTAEYIRLLAGRCNSIPGLGKNMKRSRKSKSIDYQRLSMLSSIEGIGRCLSGRLASHIGSPDKIINTPIEALLEIQGLGINKAKRIKNVLGSELK